MEELFNTLYDYAEKMHRDNRRRIKNGIKALFIIPVVILLIRYLTDSDKVITMLFWVFCTFAVVSFLIFIAYIDRDLTEKLGRLNELRAEQKEADAEEVTGE